jgi:ribosomal protein L19
MKVLFEHGGHQIVVSRGVSDADLAIDARIYDSINSFEKTQLRSFELKASIPNSDDGTDEVLVKVKLGFPSDTVTCYYNGSLIGQQKSVF